MNPATRVELIAILRGLTARQAPEVGRVLVAADFRTIEVPLNSPEPFETIKLLARAHPDCLVGAGTVLPPMDVDRVREAGGRIVVAPNCEPAVIRRALELGMRMFPGIATATEAFTAVAAGASELKLFPAATYGSRHLKALKSVLPGRVRVFPVGGIGAQDIAEWLASGADGFGFGSELFTPAYTLAQIETRARGLIEALRAATQ